MTFKKTVFGILCLTAGTVLAQDAVKDRVSVSLTDPAKPATVRCHILNGGIHVTAWDGKEVIVEAQTLSRTMTDASIQEEIQDLNIDISIDGTEKDEKKKDISGLTRIPVNSSTLTVEEKDNLVTIDTELMRSITMITLKVPRVCNLDLHLNSGDITVNNISGDLEVDNVSGKVTLNNISGSVNAHALNNELLVTMAKVTPGKPMSFSSMNGDIDVTFPADIKCNLKLKTDRGEVLTDFTIQKIEKPQSLIEENDRDTDGAFRVKIEKAFYGSINGGGPEIQFTSFTGDILIRKGS